MKRLLSMMLLWAGALNAQAISVTNLSPLPPNPSVTDSVFVAITVSTGNQGGLVSLTHSMAGANVQIEGCYFSGMLPAVDFHYDTIFLGVLPAGVYTVDMNALLSFNTSICDPVDSAQLTTSFTVGTPTPSPPCCIDVVGVNILPSLPNDTTTVYAEVVVELPSLGFIIADTVLVQGNDVVVNACYFADSIPNINNLLDTFSLGVLPAGQYNLTVNAVQSTDATNCVGIDTAVFSTGFVVDSTESGLQNASYEVTPFTVYPNPASSYVVIEGVEANSTIQLIDFLGRVHWQGKVTSERMELDVSRFGGGVYLLNVNGVTYRLYIRRN
jgi:hypothetical protein